MTFSSLHHDNDETLSRIFFASLLLHSLFFILVVINPLSLLLFELRGEEGSPEKNLSIFDVELFAFPPIPAQVTEALGLFPEAISNQSGEDDSSSLGGGFESFEAPETLGDRLPALKASPPSGRERQARKAALLMEDAPPGSESAEQLLNATSLQENPYPLVLTTQKLPPNMTGPQDCMIKVVDMVCPNDNARCITDYLAFCASLPD